MLMALLAASPAAAADDRFEVVSIKPCATAPPSSGDQVRSSPGRLNLTCVTVDSLIRAAYITYPDGKPWPVRNGGLERPILLAQWQQKIEGGSSAIKSGRVTIEAKAQGTPSETMMRGPMMQRVLQERFHVAVHRVTREVAVYELVAAKGGAKLQPHKEGNCTVMQPSQALPLSRQPGQRPTIFCGSMAASRGGLDIPGTTLDHLCLLFGQSLGRDVVNRTGLNGVYDLHLELGFADIGFGRRPGTPSGGDDHGAAPVVSDPSGTIFTAVRKLGLQLQAGKMKAEFLVVDRLEMPTAN